MRNGRLGDLAGQMTAEFWTLGQGEKLALRPRLLPSSQVELAEGRTAGATVTFHSDSAYRRLVPWQHELVVSFRGKPWWVGTVVGAEQGPLEGQVTVDAQDLSGRLGVVQAAPGSWPGETSATWDAVAGPAAARYKIDLVGSASGVAADIEVVSPSMMLATVLGQLGKAGMRWSLQARRMVFGGPPVALGPQLRGNHFASKPRMSKHGEAAATRVIAEGKTEGGVDVFAVAIDYDAEKVNGEVSRTVKVPGDVTVKLLGQVAEAQLALAAVTTRLNVDRTVGMSPDAPVPIHDLVPGRMHTISVGGEAGLFSVRSVKANAAGAVSAAWREEAG